MKGYITNGTTQDGFGARMQRTINTMAFTFYLQDKFDIDVEYIHTPFTFEGFENFSKEEKARAIGDNSKPYNEVNREGYLKRAILWDEKMCYSGPKINDINLNEFQIIDSLNNKERLFNDIAIKETNNKLYFIKYLQKEFNSGQFDVNIVDKYHTQISERFRFITPTTNNNIIIHIRRKDAINFGTARYLQDEYYLEILQKLVDFKDKYNIEIHTQRRGFDSTKYCDWQIVYDDEEEDYNLFMKMMNAKILVVGKSSFSIAAGLLNKNIIVYPPQPTKGLSRYINKKKFIKLINDGKI